MLNRRAVISTSAGLAVAALGYRAWDRGVFAGASGPAYAPWIDWKGQRDRRQPEVGAPRELVR
jgi:hypothetical protein